MSAGIDPAAIGSRLHETRLHRAEGTVVRVVGLALESIGPPSAVGDDCLLTTHDGSATSRGQVIGFSGDRVFSMPVDPIHGLAAGARVIGLGRRAAIGVGPHLWGRVLDANGQPLDGISIPRAERSYPLEGRAPQALERARIDTPFVTGVRAIDGMLTLGRGQRLGIFAGSGVGKSTLLGMIARHAVADVAVIALVGERGREVRDFIEGDLGAAGLSRAVVFVATSDESPLRRIRAAQAATAAAEYFRDQGRHVLLMMDSLTRIAMAQREVGLAVGEPPSTKGYPPSVLSLLPRLVERAGGLNAGGSITGLYTIYVEGDDLNDPVADAARSLLDGHAVLSRELATRGHYPAIDVLGSVSRLMPQVASPEHLEHAVRLRARLAALKEAEDLVLLGAYRAGASAEVDAALRAATAVRAFLEQRKADGSSFEQTCAQLAAAVEAGDEPDA